MRPKIGLCAVTAAIFIVGAAMARSANAAPPDDACSLLTQAQVSAALSVSVGAGSYMGTYKKTCTWKPASGITPGAKYVTLELKGLDSYQAGKQMGQMKNVSVTSIGGIGDDAYYLGIGPNVGLIVKKGNVSFKVAVYGSSPIEKKRAMEKTLAQEVVSKL